MIDNESEVISVSINTTLGLYICFLILFACFLFVNYGCNFYVFGVITLMIML